METCTAQGCDRPIEIKGPRLCRKHYMRQWRWGDPNAWKRREKQTCTVQGCEGAAYAHGLCSLHDARMRRYGTTERPERPTVCGVEGCEQPVQAWALCERHYRRAKKGNLDERRCRHCGNLIDPNLHASRAYCSAECKEQELFAKRTEHHRERWLRQYGLTPTDFDAMLETQGGRCAICRGDDHNGRNWCVDHDHATGAVRGLLCTDCNIGLGKFKDDPAILRAAIEYLEARSAIAAST